MADVFNAAFSAEPHAQWPAGRFAWDPSQLHALPSPESGSSGDPFLEAGHRDQSLGPVPIGWDEAPSNSPGPAPGAGKETKASRAPKGPLVCQVEGCGHDLSVEKGYYQRYRVCEPHMKLLSLVVNGKPSRFCQQCGRFQELTEFDGSKRSCRARLLQHNARRRKRDPYDTCRKEQTNRKSKSAHPWSGSSDDAEPASRGSVDVSHGVDKAVASYGMDGAVDQGISVHSLGPKVSSSSAAPAWQGGLGSMGVMPMDVPTTAPLPQSILQPLSGQPLSGQPVSGQPLSAGQPLPGQHQSAMANKGYVRWQAASAESLDPLDDVLDSILGTEMDYLDDPGVPVPSRATEARDRLASAGVTVNPAFLPGACLGGLAAQPAPQTADQMWMGSMTSSPAQSGVVLNSNNSFTSGVPVSGPWQQGVGGGVAGLDLAAQQRLKQQRILQQQQMMAQQQQMAATARPSINSGLSIMDTYMGVVSSSTAGGLAGPVSGQGYGPRSSWASANPSGTPELMSGSGVFGGSGDVGMSQATASAAASPFPAAPRPGAQSSFDLARRLVASGGAAAQYKGEDLMVRVSIKIANCTPDQLPPDLYQRLRNLCSAADATVLVQTHDEVSLWPAGAPASAAPQHSVRIADLESAHSLPTIAYVSPAVHVDGTGCASLYVFGTGLARAGVEFFARMQGGYVPVEVQQLAAGGVALPSLAEDTDFGKTAAAALRHVEALKSAGRSAEDVIMIRVRGTPGTGLLLLEAQAGPLLSNWRPCLLSTNAAIAAELSGWGLAALRRGAAAMDSLESFIIDFGRVLDKRSYERPVPPPAVLTSTAVSKTIHEEESDNEEENGDEVFADAVSGSIEGEGGVTLELVCVCERLLGWAADAGLARVSTFLMSALLQYGQSAQAILEAPYADGLSVLHRCARSGNPTAVAALANWAASCGVHAEWGGIGALGVSPLHLAALLPRTWAALSMLPEARAFWAISRATADGASPVHLQRALLRVLPRDAAAHGLAELFAAPKPRAVVRPPVAKHVEASPLSVSSRHVNQDAPLLSVAPDKASGGFAMAPLLASVLAATLAAALLAPRALQMPASDAPDAVIRTEFVGIALLLLSVAGFFLPGKMSAAMLLSQVHPASTCIPTP
ncbi:hypothetical protein GPECTOR_70g477 [Gonium pectorale]|uniref:SBP-type domain-containing protein n=1 Tax=Gonium pectorale TaxID=33097 RepID=A0A150G317_GONPE|nr:hypothetical protein GPECTOR_70g477 [Gonium pectorale]|eukprot:KXZ44247.1 hypothetical protein GPECTOR_70g477 [Gonium pectorale]